MLSIYTTQHAKFKEIGLVVCELCVSENYPIFFTVFFLFFSSLHHLIIILNQPNTSFSCIGFFQIWYTNKALSSISYLKFGDVLAESKGIMRDNIAKTFIIFSHTYKINHRSYSPENLTRDYPFIESEPL